MSIKDHMTAVLSLIALAFILITVIVLVCHKTNDTSLIVVLATGAVGIGQAIAGIKPTQPAGTSTATSTTAAGQSTSATAESAAPLASASTAKEEPAA